MDIKYKRNCQIYYDEKENATFIVKRGFKFMVRNSHKDYELLQQIIGRTVEKVAVKEILASKEANKTLQYVKLLLDKGVLYVHQNKAYPLEPKFQDYIISKFDNHYQVLDFMSQSRLAIIGNPKLVSLYKGMGIDARHAESINEDIIDCYDIIIGDFNDEELARLAGKEKHLILLKRINDASSILYMNQYDEALIDQYRKFYINSSSASDFGRMILPINILIHLLENVFIKGSKNLKYITSDATVQLFDLKGIVSESLDYYDRTLIANKDDLDIIREIEEMAKTNPNFIKETNKDNTTLCHAPICNYEVLFGYNLNNHRSSRYHEDNAKAGTLAIIQGIEEALHNIKPSEFWVCASSIDEYYLKGYLRLMSESENPKSFFKLEATSGEIVSLLDFINQSYQKELKLYYQNIYENIVGNIFITDAHGYIIYSANNIWQPDKAIKEGLYDIIGRCENRQEFIKSDLISCEDDSSVDLSDRTRDEILTILKDYFSTRSILVDEKPWAYQSYFEGAGIHIGSFYIVK